MTHVLDADDVTRPSRRALLAAGGALIVSFSLTRRACAQGQLQQAQNAGEVPKPATRLPGSLQNSPMLDAWIRIDASGVVTVFTGKAELGQGIKTALLQIAAEQIDVDMAAIKLVTADTRDTPNEGYTAGSHSMQDSGTAILNAAAQVRDILIKIAATRLALPAEQLQARNGAVVAPDGRRLGYGELVAGDVLHVRAQPVSRLKDPATHTIMGKEIPRVDIPTKVTGGVAYVQDLRLPRMLHARIVRPPSYRARLRALNANLAASLPGVVKIVRYGSFLAVVAEREYQAIQAMNELAEASQWNEEQSALPDPGQLYAHLQGLPSQDTTILNSGTPASAAAQRLEATYHRPYQMHASIGPSCAVGLYENDQFTLWTHSQGVYPLRQALAEMLRLPAAQIRCIHMEGSGCYGHNAADDVAADAALLARAVPGRPIRVQWMREDEHAWEPYGPAMVTNVKGALDASGAIVDWEYHVWSNTHSTRPGKAGNLLAATHLEPPFAPPPPEALPQPEGGGDRNAIPLYKLPNARVVHHFIPQMPVRVSALRGLGAYMNVFSLESFIDELARAAKADPVEFRLRHLDDQRARDVIRLAADRFDWASNARLRWGQGRGFAFARYKNLAAYAAVAMTVAVERETGEVRVTRVVAATDSGEAVNPDGIRNQIEGGIIQSASWTLYEAVGFDRTRITSRDWSSYPIMRFKSLPERVEVHLIDRPGEAFLGTGEAAQGPTAAALANALADATDVRIRDLPLTRARVKAAIGV